jgi:hypothetical protein
MEPKVAKTLAQKKIFSRTLKYESQTEDLPDLHQSDFPTAQKVFCQL